MRFPAIALLILSIVGPDVFAAGGNDKVMIWRSQRPVIEIDRCFDLPLHDCRKLMAGTSKAIDSDANVRHDLLSIHV